MKTFGLAAFAAVICLSAAQADTCQPQNIYARIPLTEFPGWNAEFVPVDIGGKSKLLLLDTGAFFSTINTATVDELKLKMYQANFRLVGLTGADNSNYVATSFEIGGMRGDGIQFIVTADDFGDPRIAGLLGASILTNYDLSIDYADRRLDLVDPNHCEGQVVYWPERPVTVVPFTLRNRYEIILTVTVDGKEIEAQLDTGASTSTIEKGRAQRLFDIVPGSADTPVSGNLNGAEGLTTWKHQFKSLSLAGLTIPNPVIHIIPDKITDKVNPWNTGSLLDRRVYGGEDSLPMLLGADMLKHFHVYIAYKEKKLYLTPASNAPPPAAPPRTLPK